MAWHAGTKTGYRDALTKLVQFSTSQHVSALALNAAGTGYVAGDVLTFVHAGGLLEASVEVLTVGGGGEILTFILRNMGAYGDRVSAATVVAGGTGYAVNDVLEVVEGTSKEKAKVQVATLSGSAVATVTVFEGGGAYSATPSNPVTVVNVGPAAAAGSGATFNLTFTGLIGTVGVAATGGTGSGATFDLTLTETGWSAERNRNNFTSNSLTDEKEVVLKGTVSGGDPPFVGFRSFTTGSGPGTTFAFMSTGFTSHNPAISYDLQPGSGPTLVPSNGGANTLLFDVSEEFWFSVTGRKMAGVYKNQGGSTLSYISFYLGLLNPFGTTIENPYPLIIAAASSAFTEVPDAANVNVTGITEAIMPVGFTSIYIRRITDATYVGIVNSTNAQASRVRTIYPVGESTPINSIFDEEYIVGEGGFSFFNGIALNTGGVATKIMKPTPNTGQDLFVLVPATIVRTPTTTNDINTDVHGELDNVFWISATKTDGTKVTPEDTITIGSDRYRIFANAHRREQYSFFCMKEA